MKLFDQVTGQSPEFELTRSGTTVAVSLHYDLWGWDDEEAGFIVYEGEAFAGIGDTYDSASQSYGGDRPLYVDFTATLSSAVTYQSEYGVTDWGDGTEMSFAFTTTLFSSKGSFNGTQAVDVVFGSGESDALYGGGGDDFIDGAAGNDTLDGGAGKDTLYGGAGNDTYIVDDGKDQLIEANSEGTDLVKASLSYTLGAHVERLTLIGATAINGTGNSGANVLRGNSANNLLDGKAGADTMIGGKGNDTYMVDTAADQITESTNEGNDLVKASVTYELGANIEKLILTGSGTVNGFGNSLANNMRGNNAANVLDGGGGNDVLNGGGGDDVILGGDGKDSLTGGAGIDRLYGGSGSDTYFVNDSVDRVIEDAGGGTDLVKSSVSWTMTANVDNVTLTGVTNINARGNSLNNAMIGNSGNNALLGGKGNDLLTGGAGNDKLDGGAGGDKLIGGAGADTFLFLSYKQSNMTARDFIYDFSRSQGDKIDLSAIDANSKASGNQTFKFIGDAGFHKQAGELRFEKKSGDTYVYGDVNADGKADFSVKLDSSFSLIKGDFIL